MSWVKTEDTMPAGFFKSRLWFNQLALNATFLWYGQRTDLISSLILDEITLTPNFKIL